MTQRRQTLLSQISTILKANTEADYCVEVNGLYYRTVDIDLSTMTVRPDSKGIGRTPKPRGETYQINGVTFLF